MSKAEMDKLGRFLMDAPVPIDDAIESLGISIVMDAPLPPNISGQIEKLDNGRYEISTAAGEAITRQRFTAAHELGHYILHRNLLGTGVNDDRKYRTDRNSPLYNQHIDAVHERQANSFAAKVLMPDDVIRKYVHWHNSVREMAGIFKVSPSAMQWRLKNLGYGDDQIVD